MELVSGRSLDDVIAGTRKLDERLALVPIVLAAADAIAYAHEQRIIHRDLKPKNVLVGSFGETVIIDWGLAKDLGDPTEDGASGMVPVGDGTAAGEILGSPAYMPPEQALGEPVDPRADVYAIGALLAHVLLGEAPFRGSFFEVLEAAQRGVPVALRKRQPGVPEELHAIVERAMAREAAARYPTARELAEDLRRFQSGQRVAAHRYSLGQLVRRWLARHQTAVAVGVTALAILGVVICASVSRINDVRRRADDQWARAEHSSRIDREPCRLSRPTEYAARSRSAARPPRA